MLLAAATTGVAANATEARGKQMPRACSLFMVYAAHVMALVVVAGHPGFVIQTGHLDLLFCFAAK